MRAVGSATSFPRGGAPCDAGHPGPATPRPAGPRVLLVLALLLGLPASEVAAQPGTVEDIRVLGLFRMTEPAFRHALQIEIGEPYDPARIRERFRALWDLGLFEDISIEAENAPRGGKALVIKVRERPVLSSVTYQENKVVSQTQIEDALKERDVKLGLSKPLDPKQIADVEAVIRDLLAQRGHLDSRVSHRIDDITETSKAVTFTIAPGGKTRIRSIDFVGNTVFKDRQLARQLTLTKPYRWFWPWSKKNLYHPLRWDQDVGGVRDLYLNHGHIDVDIRPPVVEVRDPADGKKKKKRKKDRKKNKKDRRIADRVGAGATEPAPTTAEPAGAGDAPAESSEPPQATPEIKRPKRLLWAIDVFEKRLERDDLGAKKRRKLRRRRNRMLDVVAKKEKKARLKAESAGRRWVHLTVPVNEGQEYRLGELSVSGNTVFTDEQVLASIPLRSGDILRNNFLKAGMDLVTRGYEDRGHLYASVARDIDRRDGEPVADVAISIDEDSPYEVARIEFEGNSSTQDRVLRRELLLNESELFSRTKLDVSRAKVNQLGYWVAQDEPVIEPVEGTNRVRIRFAGEEQGRNEIQVGGGYSGLDGAFFSGVYSTRNFLGRGQVLSTSLQIGGRADRYSISFTEPWFLNRPYTLGVRVFRQDIDFGGSFRSNTKGGGLLLGRRIKRFADVQLGYNYESVSSTALGIGLNPFATASNTISSLTPSFRYNTINNPFRPTRGVSFTFSTQVAGGPLGGDTSFLKPIVGYTGYRRATRRSYMALNTRLGLVRAWRGGGPENSANVEGIPRFQRFWLGGDTLGPRVFETRTITPLRYVRLNAQGGITEVLGDPRFLSPADLLTSGSNQPLLLEVGGDRFYLLQAEYVFVLNEQVELAAFFDVGDTLFEDQSFDFDTFRASAGIELRFHLPVFPVPLRLIYGLPVRKLEQDRTTNFQFSVGRSF